MLPLLETLHGRTESRHRTWQAIAICKSSSTRYEQQWPNPFSMVTNCALQVNWCTASPSSKRFRILQTTLVVATQISSAMDSAIRCVLSVAFMPVFPDFPVMIISMKVVKTVGGCTASDSKKLADGVNGISSQSLCSCIIMSANGFSNFRKHFHLGSR